jgi:hypothetical protein
MIMSLVTPVKILQNTVLSLVSVPQIFVEEVCHPREQYALP